MGIAKGLAQMLSVAVCLQVGVAVGNPVNYYGLGGSRAPTGQEKQVIELLRKSAQAREQGLRDEARRHGQEGLALARQSRMLETIGAALLHMSTLSQSEGDIPKALEWLEQSLLTCELVGNTGCQSNARLLRAQLHKQLGDYARASQEVDRSLKLAKIQGDAQTIANAQVLILQLGQNGSQQQAAQEVVALAEKAGSSIDAALGLRKLGRLAIDEGDLPRAEALLTDALARSRSSQNPRSVGDSLIAAGELAAAQRRPDVAARHYLEAKGIALQIQDHGLSGNASLRLAKHHLLASDLESSRKAAMAALQAYELANQLTDRGLAHEALGNVDWASGNRDGAKSHYRQAIDLAVKSGLKDNEAGSRLMMASLLRATDRPSAMQEAQSAESLYRANGSTLGQGLAVLEQGQIRGAGNDFEGALMQLRQARQIFLQVKRKDKVALTDYWIAAGLRMQGQAHAATPIAEASAATFRELGLAVDEATSLIELAESLVLLREKPRALVALRRAAMIAPEGSRVRTRAGQRLSELDAGGSSAQTQKQSPAEAAARGAAEAAALAAGEAAAGSQGRLR